MPESRLKNERSERNRKRSVAFFCTGFAVIIVFIFTVLDIIEQNMLEAALNFGMVTVLCCAYICLKKLDKDQVIYSVALVLLSFFFLYNIHIGSGQGTAIFWLFCFPPVFMFFLGKKQGLAALALYLCILCLLLFNPFSIETHPYKMAVVTRFLPSLVLVSLIAYGLEASREKYYRRMNAEHQALLDEKKQLEKALEEIKTLSGLIPICSSCKKIRDDEGYWQQVETYIEQHTKAGFSHSICPDCFKEYYPDFEYPGGDKEP